MKYEQIDQLYDILTTLYEIDTEEAKILEDSIETFLSEYSVWDSRIKHAVQEFNKIEDFINDHPNTCVYCGAKATEKDHLLPINWTGKGPRQYVPTVPSCRRCNSTIGSYPDPSIFARCQLIADRVEDSRYTTLRAGGAANVTK